MTLTAAQINTAMRDPAHMKRWAETTNRQFLIYPMGDLIDALAQHWPEAANDHQRVDSVFTQHRLTIPSGDYRDVTDPITGQVVTETLYKGNQLTDVELDRCIRWCIGQIREKRPGWVLDDKPL